MNEDVGSCQECHRSFQADDVLVPLPIADEERQVLLCAACRARLSGMAPDPDARCTHDVRSS